MTIFQAPLLILYSLEPLHLVFVALATLIGTWRAGIAATVIGLILGYVWSLAANTPGMGLSTLAVLFGSSAAAIILTELGVRLRLSLFRKLPPPVRTIDLNQIIGTIPHLVWTLDHAGKVESTCHRVSEYTGFSRDEINVRGWRTLIHPDDLNATTTACEEAARDLRSLSIEHRIRNRAGEFRWNLCLCRPVIDDQGRLIRWVGTHTDIEAQKAAQESLKNQCQLVTHANQAKSAFLADMSHEIRNPLSVMVGIGELLKVGGIHSSDVQLYIDTLLRNGQTVVQLVNDILDLSKVEAGRLELVHSPVSLRSLLEDMRIDLGLKAREKKIDLTITTADDVPDVIVTDATRLNQVITNLVSNAIKFTSVGSVKVTTTLFGPRSGNSICIAFAVEDSGVGIPPEQLNRLFEPFAQGQHSANYARQPGTGLGLAIARRIARLMGGDVELVYTQLGVGSCFRAHLRCTLP
jgi:PAS domain S-box-containing protein